MSSRAPRPSPTLLQGRFKRLLAALLGGVMVASVSFSVPAHAYPRPGATSIASLLADGSQANGVPNPWGGAAYSSEWPTLTPDGRYVAFYSHATNLVPGDDNGRADIFLRDNLTGEIERVTRAPKLGGFLADSYSPDLTPDARFIAVDSWNSFHPDDVGWSDVYLFDRKTGEFEWITQPPGGKTQQESSWGAAISDDGRYIAFDSNANNLVPEDVNSGADVFVHDRQTGETELISVASDGTHVEGWSLYPSISADGRYVAFNSRTPTLVEGDTNGAFDTFVHDRETGETTRVSVASDGTEGSAASFAPIISADGRYVAFTSEAPNLVPGEHNGGVWDIYVHDRETGKTQRVSVASDGAEANATSSLTAFSDDGRYVVMWSDATNLVPNDANDERDVFLHDRITGATELVSVATTPEGGNAMSWGIASVSADGRHVAFMSEASNLVVGDENGAQDIFIRDRGPETGIGEVSIDDVSTLRASGWASLAGTVLTKADDAADDAGAASELGADLTGASLWYRPEQEDLLVRLDVRSMGRIGPAGPACSIDEVPCPRRAMVAPLVRYGAAFEVSGRRYEVRAASIDADSPGPAFSLYGCDPECTRLEDIGGSLGSTGSEVLMTIPTAALGLQGPATISSLTATTGLGRGASWDEEWDTLSLDDARVPKVTVEAAVAPLATRGSDVQGWVGGDVAAGKFSVDLGRAPLEPNERLWVRACIGTRCGAASIPEWAGDNVDPDPDPTDEPTTDPSPTPTSTPTFEPGTRQSYPEIPDDAYFGGASPELFQPQQWGARKIKAPQAWQRERATGFGIKVAVLDSGLDIEAPGDGGMHPDFRCTGKVQLVKGADPTAAGVDDLDGHGTHVAGIIGACTNNGRGTVGVAPDSTILPFQVFSDNPNYNGDGNGNGEDDLAEAIMTATDAGAHVINMSLGIGLGLLPIGGGAVGYLPGLVPEVDEAIEYARSKGVVVVAAAGNDVALPLCEYPSLADGVICVGATDPRDLRTWYSTFPNKVDGEGRPGPAVVAPGGTETVAFCDVYQENALSTYSREHDEAPCSIDLGYQTINGTSMASPHVAGVAALVYDRLGGQRNVENMEKVTEAIVSTAVDLGTPGYDPVFAWGRVDADAAVCSVGPSCDEGVDPSPSIPAAPSELVATATSPTSVDLSWKDNSDNEDAFELERSPDGLSWTQVDTMEADTTSYTDDGLEPETSYSYRVAAQNATGKSTYSNVASTTTPASDDGGTPTPTATSDPEPDPTPTSTSGSEGTPTPTSTSTSDPVPPPVSSPSGRPTSSPSESESVEPRGVARTSIETDRHVVGYRGGFELAGRIERDASCVGALEVEISRRLHGETALDPVAVVPVDEEGTWSLEVAGRRNASFVATPRDTTTCVGSASNPLDVLVKVRIKARVPKRCKQKATLRGRVRPDSVGTDLLLQRQRRRTWRTVDSAMLDPRSRFTFGKRRCGRYRLFWPSQNVRNTRSHVVFRM